MYHVDVKELKKAMIDAGIDTIQDLSDKSGINRNTLSDILKEKIYPSSDVMVRLANTLSLPTEKCGAIFFATELTEMQEDVSLCKF